MRSFIPPAAILLALAMTTTLLAQSPDLADETQPKQATDQSPTPIPAFSAEKYARTIRKVPGGKDVILFQSQPIKIARSAEGQIRVRGGSTSDECSESTAPALPTCATVAITLFNPKTQTVTHWPEGSFAGRASVVLEITASRAHEIEEDTTTIPDESSSTDTEGATVTTQDLGQKTIEGVSANGLRTIVTLPARARGNKDTITTTHEVWTSAEMNLVIKVIDAKATSGDSVVEENVRGLEHISLSPDPALFHPPDDYQLQEWRRTNPGKPSDKFAEGDMAQYAAWFVK